MSDAEIRLRLLELMWKHPSPEAQNTAEIMMSIEAALLPWVMGEESARDLWPDLLQTEPTP